MKFVAVAVFLAFALAIGVDSASVSLSSSQLTLNGNRYPILNSGDMIALRSSYPSGSYSKYWMHCSSSYCWYGTCKGTVMTSAAWSGCSSYMYFYIHAMGKLDGQPINSGDTVSISSKAHGTSYRLYCSTSTSYQCRMYSTTSSLSGNTWFSYNYVTFQIFSRNAVDGTPIQYGDIVAFKYPYAFNSAWLYYYSSRFYPRSCSTNSKSSCAAENTTTGFRIFKKL
ncbi:uncharacterized protein LOC110047633 isoform X2 [Orbicella faveolata]|uniref:uncharacterized protein LOC110047633 isoform X2 n=1 Tax=Orbicella faveolata TaxID=48498 RepID=UPI0009E5A58D|nr:uncharacterized protein LOC110047633 isoform X2 [Orbicella faveolata]